MAHMLSVEFDFFSFFFPPLFPLLALLRSSLRTAWQQRRPSCLLPVESFGVGPAVRTERLLQEQEQSASTLKKAAMDTTAYHPNFTRPEVFCDLNKEKGSEKRMTWIKEKGCGPHSESRKDRRG